MKEIVLELRGNAQLVAELTGERLHHRVVVGGGQSRREQDLALQRVARDFADVPEEIPTVQVVVDRHSAAQMEAAKAKRARRRSR